MKQFDGISKILTIAIFTLLGASIFSTSLVSAHAITPRADDIGFQLAVIPLAPKLPADQSNSIIVVQLETARDSKPREAPQDINVVLLSDDDSVLKVQKNVVIKKGDFMTKAVVTSTGKAGKVKLTALAEGVKSGTVSMQTVKPDSLLPAKLAVYAGTNNFIPNPAYQGKIYVQILNAGNIPAITNTTLTVYLSTADIKVGSVPQYVRIPAGESGVIAGFTPTYQQGSTKITASANGLEPGEVSITTSGPSAKKLVVEVAPSTMPAPVGFTSEFTVQIQDDKNLPVTVSQDTSILITSSDNGIVKVPASVIIHAGSSYALAKIDSNGNIGTATITASAQGLSPGVAQITTVAHSPASADAPKEIQTFVIPSKIAPNGVEKALIVVQVTDTSGNTYSFKQYLYNPIFVSSSAPNVGTVEGNLVPEMTYAVTWFHSSSFAGSTTITATAEGYQTGQGTVTTTGSVPTALKIAQLSKMVVADDKASSLIVVTLVDDDGRPTPTQKDILVGLSSSDQEIAKIDPTDFIQAGNSYALVQIHPTNKAGSTTITATALELGSGISQFTTIGSTGSSSPYALGVMTVPMLPADGKTYDSVLVQLQDINGNPVPAKTDVPVTLTSSSSNGGTVQNDVTIKQGSRYGIAKLTTTTNPAKFKISASAEGFGLVEADQQTTVQPLEITLATQIPANAQYGNMTVGVSVSSNGIPLPGATVQVSGLYANTMSAITDEAGNAQSVYSPAQPGKNSVIVTASKPGYAQTYITQNINLDQVVNIGVGARTQGGKPVEMQAKLTGPSEVKTLDVKGGSLARMDNAKWGMYKISIPADFSTSTAQYKFVQWSDGVKDNPRAMNIITDSNLTAIYSAKYLLTATTGHSTVLGEGDYISEGETATISISQTSTNGFPVTYSFAGWSGDIKSNSPTIQIVMNGPMSVHADWNENYYVLLGIIAAAAGGGMMAYLKVIKPKREIRAKERTPDLDWYKS